MLFRSTKPRRRQRLRLLTTTPKDKRIAAFQPHDPLSSARFFHQQRVDVALLHRVLARLFSRVDDFRARRSPLQNLRIAEVIVHDHIGALDDLFHFQSDQADVSRTGSGEVADSFGGRRALQISVSGFVWILAIIRGHRASRAQARQSNAGEPRRAHWRVAKVDSVEKSKAWN